MLASSELSLQKTLSSIGRDEKISVVSLAYGDLICLGHSKVDFKSHLLFTMKHIYVTILHLLEKSMAPHSSTLAWKIPGTGEPGGLPSMGSHRVGHD